MATKKAQKEQERQDAIARLRKILKPGQTVYTVCTSVSGSGVYRHIKVIAPAAKSDKYDTVRDISGDVSTVLDWKWHDDGSVGVSGCGMDMGFHLIYSLSSALFRNNWKCPGEHCLSSSHHGRPDRKGEPYVKGATHTSDGGYALRQRWL